MTTGRMKLRTICRRLIVWSPTSGYLDSWQIFSPIMFKLTRNMAVDMSAEISDQNEQLDRITIKVGSNPIFILW